MFASNTERRKVCASPDGGIQLCPISLLANYSCRQRVTAGRGASDLKVRSLVATLCPLRALVGPWLPFWSLVANIWCSTGGGRVSLCEASTCILKGPWRVPCCPLWSLIAHICDQNSSREEKTQHQLAIQAAVSLCQVASHVA